MNFRFNILFKYNFTNVKAFLITILLLHYENKVCNTKVRYKYILMMIS